MFLSPAMSPSGSAQTPRRDLDNARSTRDADNLGVTDSMERARVTRRLSEAASFPIAILRGAAGSGKSVALRQYLAGCGQPFLLYDVAPQHDTLARFVRGLADALGELAPGARLSFAGAYERAMQSRDPARDLSAWLHEHIKSLHTVIALDNAYHAESDPQIASFLTRLIEASSSNLRWILTRAAPPTCSRCRHGWRFAGWTYRSKIRTSPSRSKTSPSWRAGKARI